VPPNASDADDETTYDPIDDLDAAPPAADDTTAEALTEDDEPTAGGAVGGFGARRASRALRNRRGRQRAIAAAAAVVLLIVAIAVIASGGGGSKPTRHLALAHVTTPTTGAHPPALIATTKGGPLIVYDQPNGKVVNLLSAKTDYGLPRTVLATSSQPNWLQVILPQKPNDTIGWIKGADVTTTTTDYSMRISLAQHHLWLEKAGAPVVDTGVVIGKKETPTPTGLFYVTDPVDLQAQPNGPYGAFALGLSGYSNVLPSFDGGPPQIAVHGTPYPDQVGQDISNGCVRIPSPIAVQIAKVVPLGTPVTIQA
jgi:lipoprotein-anchoring transpeptidase ErfK/SrfK